MGALMSDEEFLGATQSPQNSGQSQIMTDEEFLGAAPTSTSASNPAPSTATSIAAAPFVGFNKSIAALGAPVDVVNWGMRKLGVPVSDEPFLGSEWIKKRALGAIGANPDDHKPRSTLEHYLQTAGEGAGAMMLPEAAMGAIGRAGLGAAYPKAAEFAETMFGSPKTALGHLGSGVIGAAGGIGTEAAQSMVPEHWKPLAGMAGGFAGGIAGAGLTQLPSLATAGARAIGDFIPPMTESGRSRRAGEILESLASSPAAVRDALDNEPRSLVPGAKRTLAELTDDMGLASAQRDIQTVNPGDFRTRAGIQNEARVDALKSIGGDGAPDMLPRALQFRLSALDDHAAREIADQSGVAHRVVGEIGGVQTPEYYGTRIAEKIAPRLDAAREEAVRATQQMGGNGTPEQYGSALRGAAQGAKDPARESVASIYNAIDPDGNLNTVVAPLRHRANQLASGIDRLAKQPSGEEANILAQVQALPDVIPFRSLQALDSRITSAMAEERRAAGESPVWGRLSQLKSAVGDAINNGAENQKAFLAEQAARREHLAAQEAADIFTDRSYAAAVGDDFRGDIPPPRSEFDYGDMPRGNPQGHAAPLSDDRPLSPEEIFSSGRQSKIEKPVDIVKYLRSVGGIDEQSLLKYGGQSYVDSLRSRFPGLVKKQGGLKLDYARESAAESGYLGADAGRSVHETVIDDLLDAIEGKAYSARDGALVAEHTARQAASDDLREYQAAAANILHESEKIGLDRPKNEILKRAAKLNVDEGLEWNVALEKAAVQEYNERPELRTVQDAISPGVSPRASGEVPQGTRKRDRLDETGRTRDARESVRNAGETGRDTLQAGGERDPSALEPNFDEAAVERLNAGKRAHAEFAKTFRQGPVGNMLRTNGFSGQYRLIDSGVPDTVFAKGAGGFEKAQAFFHAVKDDSAAADAFRNYAAMTLRRVAQRPDGTIDPAKFTLWRRAYTDALRSRPEIEREFANVARASSALERFKPFREDLAPSAVPEMFFHSGASGGEGVRDLRRIAGDREAEAILTDYAASRLRYAALRPDGMLDPAKTATWLKQHEPALNELPGLADRFKDAASATKAVEDAAALRNASIDEFQKGAIGKLMKVSDPADVAKTVGGILGQKNAVSEMTRLAKEASRDPDAKEGLRRALADYMIGRFIGNTEVGVSRVNGMKSDQFQTFVKSNMAALSKVFSPEDLEIMGKVAASLNETNRATNAARIPGQSNTAQDLISRKRAEPPSSVSLLAKIGAGAAVGSPFGPVGVIKGAALGGAEHLIETMRAAGFNKLQDLVKEAFLDPDLAKTLMAQAPAKAGAGAEVTFRQKLLKLAPFYATNSAIGASSDKPKP